MRIKNITEDAIIFDNGSSITYKNKDTYADFSQLDIIGRDYKYDTDLTFELESCGFAFGDELGSRFFIPCYDITTGGYTDEINIYYNNVLVLSK